MNKSFNNFKMKNNLKVYYCSDLRETEQLNSNMEGEIMTLENEKGKEIITKEDILEVGIDAGNGNLKYAYLIERNGKPFIKTGYIESNISLETKAEDGDLTFINGVGYDFNTADKVISKVVRGKDTKEHRGLLYKALIDIKKETAKLLGTDTGYSNFDVVFGCSIDSWKIDKGASVKNIMTEATTLDIKTDEEDYTIRINDLQIQPECATAIYGFLPTTIALLKPQEFLLVDIGNLNVGYIKYLKGFKRDKDLKINCNGMDTILTGLCEYLNERDIKRRPITEHQLKTYLLDTEKYKDERFIDRERIIQEYMDRYIADFIKTASKSFDNDLSSDTKIVFIGGGAIALDRFLDKAVGKVLDNEDYNYEVIKIKEDVLFSNAKAFLNRAKKLFKKGN